MATFAGVCASVRLLAMAWLLTRAAHGDAGEIVYVAMGGSYPFAGAPQPGDPGRIANRLRQSGRPVRLVDLTVEGATVRHVRESQLPRTIAFKPHLVTVAVGPADAAGDVSLGSFARDLHVVTDPLRRQGAKVAISTLPPPERLREAPAPAFRRRVDAFNWAIRRNAHHNAVHLAELGATESLVETSWADAVAAVIGNAPPPPDATRRGRAAGSGAALVPPPAVPTGPTLNSRAGRRAERPA